MNSIELHQLFSSAWCAETAMGKWNPENPSLNQCAVTALAVQDLLGGVLLRCELSDGGSHYWNKLPDGSELDLCAGQFQRISAYPLKDTTEERTRERVLEFTSTQKRYLKLLDSINDKLTTKVTPRSC